MLDKISAYKFDWDAITVEGYVEEKDEAILVFNFDIQTVEKIDNAIQYVVGRVVWAYKNLPVNAIIRLSFDFRGQNITSIKSDSFEKELLARITGLNLKIENQIVVKILI
jgi:hypothetical protein